MSQCNSAHVAVHSVLQKRQPGFIESLINLYQGIANKFRVVSIPMFLTSFGYDVYKVYETYWSLEIGQLFKNSKRIGSYRRACTINIEL